MPTIKLRFCNAINDEELTSNKIMRPPVVEVKAAPAVPRTPKIIRNKPIKIIRAATAE